MYERFTFFVRMVMRRANQEAHRFNHDYVGTEHILLGLIEGDRGVGITVLENLDVDLRKLRLEVEKLVQSGPDEVAMGKLPQTPGMKRVIEYSMEEARNLKHNYVGTGHILLGLLREQEGVAGLVLMNLGLTLGRAREEVVQRSPVIRVSSMFVARPVEGNKKHQRLRSIARQLCPEVTENVLAGFSAKRLHKSIISEIVELQRSAARLNREMDEYDDGYDDDDDSDDDECADDDWDGA